MIRRLVMFALPAVCACAAADAATHILGTSDQATGSPQRLGELMTAGLPTSVDVARARGAVAAAVVRTPLPAGGNFNGIQWENLGGRVSAQDIDLMLQYNALCQWLRARADGRERHRAAAVLSRAPSWPAFRGPESEQVVRAAVQGGGQPAAAALTSCRNSHRREVAYATRLRLAPSS